MLVLAPVTLREARAFVARVHRHHRPPQGGLFAIAAAEKIELPDVDASWVRAVVIVGRPVARHLAADDYTAEVTRLASDGAPNACSMLYAAAWRAARAMGYRRLITYTLDTEPGTSLRAAGWREVGRTKPEGWDRPSRPRVDTHPTQSKIRWESAT